MTKTTRPPRTRADKKKTQPVRFPWQHAKRAHDLAEAVEKLKRLEDYEKLPVEARELYERVLDVINVVEGRRLARLDRDSVGFPTDHSHQTVKGSGDFAGYRHHAHDGCPYPNGHQLGAHQYADLIDAGIVHGNVSDNEPDHWDYVDEAGLLPVEAAAAAGAATVAVRADEFLAESAESLAGLRSAARRARTYWPRPFPPGTEVGGLIVGQLRSSTADICPWCGDPVTSGRNENTGRPLAHKVDDWTLHAEPCYQQAYRTARKTDVYLGAVIAAKVHERETG